MKPIEKAVCGKWPRGCTSRCTGSSQEVAHIDNEAHRGSLRGVAKRLHKQRKGREGTQRRRTIGNMGAVLATGDGVWLAVIIGNEIYLSMS